MTDVRALRLAIQSKLDQRRALLTANAALRAEKERTEKERDVALKALGSPFANYCMEAMADEIASAVIDEAWRASETVARETVDGGFYEVGIEIPPIRILRCFHKGDLDWDHGLDAGEPFVGRRFSYVAQPRRKKDQE